MESSEVMGHSRSLMLHFYKVKGLQDTEEYRWMLSDFSMHAVISYLALKFRRYLVINHSF